MDEIKIHESDRERIEASVAQYRKQLETLYRMAYLQGAIDSETKAVEELRRKVAA